MNNKNISFVMVLLILFSFTSCTLFNRTSASTADVTGNSSSEASWAHGYTNIEEMFADSWVDLVVVGRIESIAGVTKDKTAENSSRGPIYMYFTDFTFSVERVLKGTDTREITIHQTGAEGEKYSIIEQDPLFQPGEEYVLFLHEYSPGKTFVAAGPGGRFRIVDEKVYSMNYLLPPDLYFPPSGLDTNGVKLADFIGTLNQLADQTAS